MLGPEYSRGTGVGESVSQMLCTCKIFTQAESSARSVAQNETLVCSSVVWLLLQRLWKVYYLSVAQNEELSSSSAVWLLLQRPGNSIMYSHTPLL